MSRLLLSLILLAINCLSIVAGQDPMTVDATTQPSPPPRERALFPGSASPGHSAGLPIQLDLLIPTAELRLDGTVLVDFVVTNVGTQPIRLPSSVNQIEQQTSVLTLWLTSDAIMDQYAIDQQTGRPFKIEAVGTSAELYGCSDDPRTFITLAPNKSMQVHASSRVQFQPGRHAATAHAEVIHLVMRNGLGSSENVGTADSRAVTKTFSASGSTPR
jgi:hypothetical protein